MSPRTRRRVYVMGLAAALGATAPAWSPPLLSRLPLFDVREVGVVGTRYVQPDEVVRRAGVAADASVWDDPAGWEAAVEGHPLVRGATVERVGLSRLEIQVREVEPVALVPGDGLVPVDAEGRTMPLDPAEADLDLPLLPGAAVEDGRLADGRDRLEVLVALRRAEPGFVRRVSTITAGEHGSLRVRLTEGQACDVVLLPAARPVAAFRRVERALGRHEGGDAVRAADARFEGQVVLRLGSGAEGGAAGPAPGAVGGRG